MAEMVQVQVPGGFRLERGKWHRVETFVYEHPAGTREFHSTRVSPVERLPPRTRAQAEAEYQAIGKLLEEGVFPMPDWRTLG